LHLSRHLAPNYRVIYVIEDEIRGVTIMAIEHRSDVYRSRQL